MSWQTPLQGHVVGPGPPRESGERGQVLAAPWGSGEPHQPWGDAGPYLGPVTGYFN